MKNNVLIVLLIFVTSSLLGDDKVRNETGVDKVWSEHNIKGNGVIVAILDRGIDYTHPDFLNEDGTTRILYIYDLTDNSGAGASDNPYNVGTIYSADKINAALSSGVLLKTRDAVGHGTSTTGLAAGNGRASNGMYSGMAPNAQLIIVKIVAGAPAHDGEPAEAPFFNIDLIETGIDFIKSIAIEAKSPVVMLANIGSVGGPMDGTSKNARMIDSKFGVAHPGHVFISGSSDDGGLPNHASGTIAQGQTIDLKVKNSTGQLRLDLWYNDSDLLNVEIVSPTKTYGPYPAPATNQLNDQQFTSEFNYYHKGSDVDFYEAHSKTRQIMIDFLAVGNYILRLTGSNINDGNFHASLNPSRIFNGEDNAFESYVVPGYTVWDMASAKNNITPNSYVIRKTWQDINGVTRTENGNEVGEGALWVGSGVGPTYDGRNGITVSVPGNSNIAPYAERSYFASFDHALIKGGNGKYGIQGAVSGAAPVLTGIIALMLEANPQLDAIQIREILQNTAKSDAFTGSTPNPRWGHGKVDAFSAVTEVMNTLSTENITDIPANFTLLPAYPNPFNPSTTIRYGLDSESNVIISIYDITGKLIDTLLNSEQSQGWHSLTWDGTNQLGEQVPAGVYLSRVTSNNNTKTTKLMLLK